ncbi:LacI family DNA-binding transcriptional regulator [Hydrogenophaga pseudoflava]|uniref:LacI family DNA-binding transcriptional regulator n=1 Tax=Hydrogenophaga pseudoflava TaxID=47421 RepID=UPI0027E4D585|nr:LacI family DNA-binding transcriptional regulator [Hydrogenophaga pseudoflava]MDQ7742801.1 LacI family DNA-binding transcriptional regulator [Hydrogenophaga pseudoflava]
MPPAPPPLPSRPRATGRVTLADVAALAGVSPITVSRTLRGERTVDPVLAARVKEAAQQLRYVPDPAARALASRHGSHVAVLIPMLSNALFVDLLEAVQRTLRPAGYQTLIGITHYSPDEEEQLLREQLQHRPAGLLVTGIDQNAATRELMAHSGVPCVHLMELSTDPALYCVGFSQRDAGEAITRHLLARGRRRIAFAAAQLDPRTLQRAEGYRRALQSAGLYDPALEWLDPRPSSMALGGELLERLLREQPGCDAVFFCNDDLAQGGLLAALRLDVAVPHRLAVAGFNDLSGSDQMLPPLTTVATPRGAIGEASAQMLLSLMRGDTPARHSVDLGFELRLRAST